jgi:hypothetical protein
MKWLDNNPRHADRRAYIKQLVDLSNEGYLPTSLFIDGLQIAGEGIPVAGGSFSDVFKGTYGTQEVAIKRFRFFFHTTELGKDKLYKVQIHVIDS